MVKNPIEIIKNGILLFARRFYDPKIPYADTLINEWVNSFVKWFMDILLNGFIGYLALFALTYLFNVNIYLGDSLWQLPFTIILIGILSWFITNLLKIIPPIFKITTRG